MAKRTGPRPVEPTDGDEAMVPAAQVDVWRGALNALDAAREAIRQCAVYASSRPGQAHAGAVEGLSAAVENVGIAAAGVVKARGEVEAAEWQTGAGS